MTAPPVGFAPVFKGWNVWDVWQADDPDESVLDAIWTAGMSQERLLRVWVENELKENAPGVAVADPLNPAALRGDQVQPIPRVQGLAVAVTRSSVPGLGGALQVGTPTSKASLRTVRFFNRGDVSVLPWPRDKNFVLDSVYTPSTSNPVTSAPAPDSLAGAAGGVGKGVASALDSLVWIAAGVAAVVVISKLPSFGPRVRGR